MNDKAQPSPEQIRLFLAKIVSMIIFFMSALALFYYLVFISGIENFTRTTFIVVILAPPFILASLAYLIVYYGIFERLKR